MCVFITQIIWYYRLFNSDITSRIHWLMTTLFIDVNGNYGPGHLKYVESIQHHWTSQAAWSLYPSYRAWGHQQNMMFIVPIQAANLSLLSTSTLLLVSTPAPVSFTSPALVCITNVSNLYGCDWLLWIGLHVWQKLWKPTDDSEIINLFAIFVSCCF